MREINETLKVDIFGKCGNLKCSQDSDDCDDLLEEKYFFYLSFENAICNDYVTEKLYRALRKFVIPIVFNGANNSLFAPPKSYINANDFKTAKELTKYLQFLIENPDEYMKYFWWKKHYYIIQQYRHTLFMQSHMLCDVCKMLNDPKVMRRSQRYQDIDKWWEENQCKSPKIKFKLI